MSSVREAFGKVSLTPCHYTSKLSPRHPEEAMKPGILIAPETIPEEVEEEAVMLSLLS